MKRRMLAAVLLGLAAPVHAASTVVIVQGLGGNDTYRQRFDEQVEALEAAAATLAPNPVVRVFREKEASREAVLDYLASLGEGMTAEDELYVYLVGHGSYDEEEYKFNIPGPDLTDADLLAALDGIPSGNQLVVNTSSASGAAADSWQAGNRILITATRSGAERHATRFGEHFVAALSDPAADVDKNRIVTAQEAFDYADRRVAEYFEESDTLATEHARLDGRQAARFSLARLDGARATIDDERLAGLERARDEIAGRIDDLRLARDDMSGADYQGELLDLMLDLAEAEEAIEERRAELEQP